MSAIEISTSHNIVVQFELASLGQRILAWIIDFALLLVLTLTLNLSLEGSMIVYIISFFAWLFYSLLFEIFNDGQSIGKKALKIRVVHLNGKTPSLNDYLIRWVFRMIETIPSFGSIAILFISSSEKGQRIGDMLAHTSVVKKKNENVVQLSSLKNVNAPTEIEYLGLSQFGDQDMLLVKHALFRYNLNPNPANTEVLESLASSIADKLSVKLNNVPKKKFLDKVLLEYIVLTR